MALWGKGALAIWNDVDPEAEADFVAWHVSEHIPERVDLPGFLRGRRYVAVEGRPKYFNIYETERTETLRSPHYLARLNDPSPWTRRVVAHFRNTSRTICDVAASIGRGEGPWIEAIQLKDVEGVALPPKYESETMPALAADPAICGVHLLRGCPTDIRFNTAESKLRAAPDEAAEWILLVEAIDEGSLRQLRAAALSENSLTANGAFKLVARGLYRLQFCLCHCELVE
jgi:hypothetical protein